MEWLCPQQYGNRHPQIAPYEPVQAKDGRWFILGVGSDNTWRKFCEVAGLDELGKNPRYATNADRVSYYDELMPQISAVIGQRTAEDWLERLRDAEVPVGKINSVSEALADLHLLERNFIVELEHPSLGMLRSLATPVHMSMTPLQYERHPPLLGEHTEQVLAEMGYSTEQIRQFQTEGVV